MNYSITIFNTPMQIELNHHGSIAEKSAVQKLNQGVWTNVLKPKVRKDK